MTDDDLRLLGDIHAGLPPTFDYLYFEVANVNEDKPIAVGDRIEGHLHAADLPDDARTLIDAVPGLIDRIKALEGQVGRLQNSIKRLTGGQQ